MILQYGKTKSGSGVLVLSHAGNNWCIKHEDIFRNFIIGLQEIRLLLLRKAWQPIAKSIFKPTVLIQIHFFKKLLLFSNQRKTLLDTTQKTFEICSAWFRNIHILRILSLIKMNMQRFYRLLNEIPSSLTLFYILGNSWSLASLITNESNTNASRCIREY